VIRDSPPQPTVQHKPFHVRPLVLGIALTVLLLLGQAWLPERSMDLAAPGAVSNFFLIAPGEVQGEAPVQWIDVDRRHWRCHYPSQPPSQGCGMTLVLSGDDPKHGLDLSHFDSLVVDLAYKGSSPYVRVALRNFDPRFSKLEDGNSSRMQSVNLRQRDIAAPVVLDLGELTVPEWWITQFNLPREYNRPSVENVTTLSIDVPADVAGQPQDMELRHLTLKGPWIARDTVYLGLLCGWLLAASLVVAQYWRALHRSHIRQQREIDALTARTRVLRIEQDKLRRLATIDELTGVLNRRGLESALEDFETHSEGVALVLLDIDHFKHINDRWGHAVGDEVLRRMAAVVTANLRASDVIGRWGGEEFLVACQGRHVDDAVRLAEKLREAVQNAVFDAKGRFAITASFGVALAPPGYSAHRAFKRADAALYRAKSGGRNRVEVDTAAHDAATTL
jgi:diguanylate cyclase (GGDEF)-like protein